jgi:hypothetical protein
MPVVNIQKNIDHLKTQIQGMREEVLRLEGVLRTYKQFENSGLTKIDLPHHNIGQIEEETSIQEKPE